MKTVEARVPVSQVPQLKAAARELGIEMITAEQEDTLMVCHFLVYDYGDLISLGVFAGVNGYFNSISSPLKELMDTLESRIEKMKNEKDNNQN